eukprot:2515793-Pleurochrysis_carterae.AAC.1
MCGDRGSDVDLTKDKLPTARLPWFKLLHSKDLLICPDGEAKLLCVLDLLLASKRRHASDAAQHPGLVVVPMACKKEAGNEHAH